MTIIICVFDYLEFRRRVYHGRSVEVFRQVGSKRGDFFGCDVVVRWERYGHEVREKCSVEYSGAFPIFYLCGFGLVVVWSCLVCLVLYRGRSPVVVCFFYGDVDRLLETISGAVYPFGV